MKKIALAIALLASTLAPSLVQAHETAGIVPVRIETGAAKAIRFNPLRGKRHVVAGPTVRRPWDQAAGGCEVRALEGDASGQTVTACE